MVLVRVSLGATARLILPGASVLMTENVQDLEWCMELMHISWHSARISPIYSTLKNESHMSWCTPVHIFEDVTWMCSIDYYHVNHLTTLYKLFYFETIIPCRWKMALLLFGGLRQMHADPVRFIMCEGDILSDWVSGLWMRVLLAGKVTDQPCPSVNPYHCVLYPWTSDVQ